MVSSVEAGEWQFNSKDLFVPITYEGNVVAFGKPKFAARVVEVLNEEEKLRKAFEMACHDLLSHSGGDINRVEELMRHYISKSDRPKTGAGAIAALLRDRKRDLDITEQEFVKFCDSYRLAPADLNGIYAGRKINDNMLVPLSRILGISLEELVKLRDG